MPRLVQLSPLTRKAGQFDGPPLPVNG